MSTKPSSQEDCKVDRHLLDSLYANLIRTPENVHKISCITCGDKMKLILIAKHTSDHVVKAYRCQECSVIENFLMKL